MKTKVNINDCVQLANDIYEMSDFIASYGDQDVEVLVKLKSHDVSVYSDGNLEDVEDYYQTAVCSVNGDYIQDYQLIDDLGELGVEALNVFLSKTSTMYAFRGLSLEVGKTYFLNYEEFRINEDLEFELI